MGLKVDITRQQERKNDIITDKKKTEQTDR